MIKRLELDFTYCEPNMEDDKYILFVVNIDEVNVLTDYEATSRRISL